MFSKNRERLLNQELAQKFFTAVKEQALGLMSDEHFTVDGTLIEAWAGQKSFRRKDGQDNNDDERKGGGGDFHGERRKNETHASSTDPEARLYKKAAGQEAKLCYLGHTLVEKPFGWLKQIGPMKKVKLRGLAKVDWLFVFSCAAFKPDPYSETAGAARIKGWNGTSTTRSERQSAAEES